MRKIALLAVFIGLLGTIPFADAQGMMGLNYDNGANNQIIAETTADEAKGKAIWDRLQAKQVECNTLTEDDFDVLGDYFMGQMMGNGHAAMNERMSLMMGDQAEKQMHVAMGKRLSGCDSSAVIPSQYQKYLFMPMMSGNYNNPDSTNRPWRNMMGGYGSFAFYFAGWVTLILFWTMLVFAILALARYVRSAKRK